MIGDGILASATAGLYTDGHLNDYGLWAVCAICSTIVGVVMYKASSFISPLLFSSYSKLDEIDKRDWDGRYYSVVYSAFISVMASYIILGSLFRDSNKTTQVPVVFRTSSMTMASLGITAGYFGVDTVITAWYHPHMGGTPMLCHHFGALLSTLVGTWTGHFHLYLVWIMCTEVTTPFIMFRWFLEKSGLKTSKLYFYNGLFIFFFWLTGRVLIFVPYFYTIWQYRADVVHGYWHTKLLLFTVPTMLFVLNMWWFSKIFKAVLRRLRGSEAAEPSDPSRPKESKKTTTKQTNSDTVNGKRRTKQA